MSRADDAFQESFLNELQRLENGGDEGPTAVDKLAAAIGLEDAPTTENEPAAESTEADKTAAAAAPAEVTYDSLLSKLAQTGAAFGGKPSFGQRMAGAAKAVGTGVSKAVGATVAAAKAHPKPAAAIGGATALAGGYAAYRAMKKKDKD